ncbi:MAG: SDR family oxidoreductase [Actinobacteria bacterium]|nr:SDR family oxidoreductase [Actinomycetota bacterium]
MMPVSRRISRALVTGASAGIGEEFARQLASRGTSLVLVARRRERLQELADELAGPDRSMEVLAADLTDADDLRRVERRLTDTDAPVDLLVNNAGFGMYGEFTALDGDRQLDMVTLHVNAPTRLAHAIAPRLRAEGGGGIINVASTAAFQPDPYGAVYGATKAYVLTLSEALHEELRGAGVRVTALCPGFTTTEFQDVASVDQGALPSPAVLTAEPVVRAGLDAFTRGQAVCLPGVVNKLLAYGSEVSPSPVSRWVSKLTHKRFTA